MGKKFRKFICFVLCFTMAIPFFALSGSATYAYADNTSFENSILTNTLGDTIGMYGFEGAYALGAPHEIVEIIVQFRTPPAVALRLMNERRMPQARGFAGATYEAQALTAHSAFQQQLNQMPMPFNSSFSVPEIFSEHHSLLNGVYMRVSSGMVEMIAALPEVYAVFPNYTIHTTSAGSFFQNPELLRVTREYMGIDYINNQMGITGRGVRVAVIDTGIDHNHPEFIRFHCPVLGRIRGGTSSQPNRHGGDDHGTMVSGTVIGIAPNVELWNYRVDMYGAPARLSAVGGIEAAHRDGVQVMNLSFGAWVFHPFDPLTVAASLAVLDGVVVVASAGNQGGSMGYRPYVINSPGNSPLVITVGSGVAGGTDDPTGTIDSVQGYSSHGPVQVTYHIKPDILASTPVYSTILNGGYEAVKGTSFSGPVIAGIAALLLEQFPTAQPWEIKSRIMNTARGITNPNPYPSHPSYRREGVFNEGAGFVQPHRALTQEAFATVIHRVPMSVNWRVPFEEHIMSSLSFGSLFRSEAVQSTPMQITIHNPGAGTWTPHIYFNGNRQGVDLVITPTGANTFSARMTFSAGTPLGIYEGNLVFTNGDQRITMPFAARLADPPPRVHYIDASGSLSHQYVNMYAGQTRLYAGWYFVSGTHTLPWRVVVTGDVRIILADGAHFDVSNGGIQVDGGSLTIYAQSTGSNMGRLTADGSRSSWSGMSGIGGGRVTINGGTITAIGGSNAPALGGGSSTVAINGSFGFITNTSSTNPNATLEFGVATFGGTTTQIGGRNLNDLGYVHLTAAAAIDDYDAVNADTSGLTWERIQGENIHENDVQANLDLPTIGSNGTAISWVSTSAAVIDVDGVVVRPAAGQGNADVTLTATISRGTASETREFFLTVTEELSDAESVVADAIWLTWARIRGANTLRSNVTNNLQLPTIGLNASTITWSSSDTDIVADDGFVMPPRFLDYVEVTLTAYITNGAYSAMPIVFELVVFRTGGDIIVRASYRTDAYINLTTETLHIPDDFTVLDWSMCGFRWRRGPLPTDSVLFRRMGSRFSTRLIVRSQRNELWWMPDYAEYVIQFPAILGRPRVNEERLRPWYDANTWTLRPRPARTHSPSDPPPHPGYLYEWVQADASGRLPVNPQWTPLSYRQEFEIPQSGRRTTFFFRRMAECYAAEWSGGLVGGSMAGRPFRVRPATLRNAPNVRVTYTTETIRLNVRHEYSIDDGLTWRRPQLDDRERAVPLNISQYIADGRTMLLRTATTGRRTRSLNQVVALQPRAELVQGALTSRELNIDANGRIIATELQRSVNVAGMYRNVPYNVWNESRGRWTAVPRMTAAIVAANSPYGLPDTQAEFTIRLNPSARNIARQWEGYAASAIGTLHVTWGIIGQDSRGRDIIGITRAVITAYGDAPPTIVLYTIPPQNHDTNNTPPFDTTTGAALQVQKDE